MEITEISMLSDFEAGMKCLQNPSILSRFSPFPQLYSFCKWGALFLAFFATFTSVLRKIKLLTIRRINSLVSPSQPLFTQLLAGDDDDFDFSDDDDVSSSGTVSDDDEEFDSTSSFEDQNQNAEYVYVAGSSLFSDDRGQNDDCGLRRRNRFSWSDFSAGKSVVKLWDSFGFGLDFDENDDDSEVPIWDFNGDVKMSDIFGGKYSISAGSTSSSPDVVLSAELSDNDCVLFGAYDRRMGRESPAIYAEWRPRRGKPVGVGNGGMEKVYVMDSVDGALTVGDLRNVKTPLEN